MATALPPPAPRRRSVACAPVPHRQTMAPPASRRTPDVRSCPSHSAPAREVMRAEDRLWLTRPGPQVVHWVAEMADTLEPAALAAHIDGRRAQLPHFSERIARTERGAPCWEAVPRWRALDHLRSVKLTRDPEALQRTLDRLSQEPLRPDRPPWEIVLLQQPCRGTVLVFRGHHAMADGRGLVEALYALHDDPEQARASCARLAPARRYQGTANGPVVDGFQAVLDTFTTMTRLLMGPPERNAQLKGDGQLAQRHTTLGPWSVSEVKEAAHAFGGTVNDLLLTVIARGVQRYLEAQGEHPERAPLNALQIVAVPRKLRQQGGNAVTAVSTPLPMGPGNITTRFAAVRGIMKAVKESWRPEMMRNAQRLALVLPPGLQKALYRRSADQHSVIISNIQGSAMPLRFAGHTVRQMRWFGPPFGSVALQFSALSYAGQFTVGVSTNTDVIQDAPALEAAVAAAYAEVTQAARAQLKRS